MSVDSREPRTRTAKIDALGEARRLGGYTDVGYQGPKFQQAVARAAMDQDIDALRRLSKEAAARNAQTEDFQEAP